jgi:hypothetical protein
MELYCRAAQPVARTTPIRGMPQQNEEQESR